MSVNGSGRSTGSTQRDRSNTSTTGTTDTQRTQSTPQTTEPARVADATPAGTPATLEEKAPVSAQVKRDSRTRAAADPTSAAMRASLEAQLNRARATPAAVTGTPTPTAGASAATVATPAATPAPTPVADPAAAVEAELANPTGTAAEQGRRLNDIIRAAPPDQQAGLLATVMEDTRLPPADSLDRSIAATAGLDPAVVDQAAAIRETRETARNEAYTAIQGATDRAEDAQAAVAYAEQKLAEEVRDLAPVLSEAELASYQANYWSRPENAALKADAAAANDALAATLREHEAALAPDMSGRQGRTRQDQAASTVTSAYAALANDPAHGEAVRDFAARALDPENPAHASFQERAPTIQGALANAAQAQADQVLRANGTPADAYAAARDYLGPVAAVADISSTLMEGLDEAARGNASALSGLDLSGAGPAASRLAGIAALAGITSAVASGRQGQYADALTSALGATSAGLDFTSGLLRGIAAGKDNPAVKASLEAFAADAAAFGKVAGALGGVLGSAKSLATYMGPDGKPGDALSAALGAASTVAAFVPGWGTAASGVLGAAAFAADLWASSDRAEDVRRSKEQGLVALGMDPAVASEIAAMDPDTIRKLGAVGIDSGELQSILREFSAQGFSMDRLGPFMGVMLTPQRIQQLQANMAQDIMMGPDSPESWALGVIGRYVN